MTVDFYFLIGIISLVIHSLLNFDVLYGNEYKSDYVNIRPYRRFLFSIADFFLVDTIWGLANWLKIKSLMYIATIVYNLSLAYVILCWMSYIGDYVKMNEKASKSFKLIGKTFAIFACVTLLINHILVNVFYIDSSGLYKATYLRYVALLAIVSIYGSSAVFAIRNMKNNKNDSIVMLSFSLICIISSFVQMLNSLFPAYSIGFLVGCTFIHTFLYSKYKKDTEKKLIEASKAKSDYLYSMSHDIRTPMNAIVGFSELIEKHYDEKEKCLSYVEKIKGSSDFLLSLINNVLDIASIESGKATLNEGVWDSLSIDKDIYALFEKQALDKNIKFTIKKDMRHNYCYCDKVKLREVLLNLISNAFKYTPENGSVTVDVKELECEQEGYASYKLTVSDTGVGMSKEYLPHVFDKFVRETTSKGKDSGGTGLGLPIVKSIIDLMGGSIIVDSKLGEGTTFIVTFKLKIAEKPQEKTETVEQKDLANKVILVVEDNDINAEVITAILEDMSIIVKRAKDGKQAIDMILNNTYDCILMDIQMPYYNGYEVTKTVRQYEVRTQQGRTPIIAMTASTFEKDRLASIEVGMNDFVSKPIEVDKLKIALSNNIK